MIHLLRKCKWTINCKTNIDTWMVFMSAFLWRGVRGQNDLTLDSNGQRQWRVFKCKATKINQPNYNLGQLKYNINLIRAN